MIALSVEAEMGRISFVGGTSAGMGTAGAGSAPEISVGTRDLGVSSPTGAEGGGLVGSGGRVTSEVETDGASLLGVKEGARDDLTVSVVSDAVDTIRGASEVVE